MRAVVMSVVVLGASPFALAQPWLERLTESGVSSAELRLAARDVPRGTLVPALINALDHDPRFAAGTHARLESVILLADGADYALLGSRKSRRPPLAEGPELDALLRLLFEPDPHGHIPGIIVGALDERLPPRLRERVLDQVRARRTSEGYELLNVYLGLVGAWQECARVDDADFVLRVALDAPDLPPATRRTLAEVTRDDGWKPLRESAFAARWRLGLMVEDLPRVEALDDVGKEHVYALLLGAASASGEGAIPLADADVPRVWGSIEAYYARNPRKIPEYYRPEQSVLHALRAKRSDAALREIHRVVRGIAIAKWDALAKEIAPGRPMPPEFGAALVDDIMANPEKHQPTPNNAPK